MNNETSNNKLRVDSLLLIVVFCIFVVGMSFWQSLVLDKPVPTATPFPSQTPMPQVSVGIRTTGFTGRVVFNGSSVDFVALLGEPIPSGLCEYDFIVHEDVGSGLWMQVRLDGDVAHITVVKDGFTVFDADLHQVQSIWQGNSDTGCSLRSQ